MAKLEKLKSYTSKRVSEHKEGKLTNEDGYLHYVKSSTPNDMRSGASTAMRSDFTESI